jgi:hypothetical protein
VSDDPGEVVGLGGTRGQVVTAGRRRGPLLLLAAVVVVVLVAALAADRKGSTTAAPDSTTIPPTTTTTTTTTTAVEPTTSTEADAVAEEPTTAEVTTTTEPLVVETGVPDAVRGQRMIIWSRDLSEAHELVLGEPGVTERSDLVAAVPPGFSAQAYGSFDGPAGTMVFGDQGGLFLPIDGGPPAVTPFTAVGTATARSSDGVLWGLDWHDELPDLVGWDPASGETVARLELPVYGDLIGELAGRPVLALSQAGQYAVVTAGGGIAFVGEGRPIVATGSGVLLYRCDDGPVCSYVVERADGSVIPIVGLGTASFPWSIGAAGEVAFMATQSSDPAQSVVAVDLRDGGVQAVGLGPAVSFEDLFVLPDASAVIGLAPGSLNISALGGDGPVQIDLPFSSAWIQFVVP